MKKIFDLFILPILLMSITAEGLTVSRNNNPTITGTLLAGCCTNPPTAYAGPGAIICQCSTYQLCSATATYYSCLNWTTSGTGTFNNASTLHPVYTPSTADINTGSATLTLTATGNAPCPNATSSMTLTITKAATAFAGPNATICQGATYALSSSTATNYTSLLWTTSGNGTFSCTSTLHPTYTPGTADISAGHVSLTLTATASAPCPGISGTMTLTINPLTTISTQPQSQSVCSGATATFIVAATGSGTLAYQWLKSTNNGTSWSSISGATNATLALTASLSMTGYKYKCTVTGGCSTVTSSVAILTVRSLPVPSITGPSTVCVNSAGNVYTTQTGMTNYSWVVSGGTITAGGNSTSNTATVTWTVTGSKTISVNYSNSYNCNAAAPVVYNVTVNPSPAPTISGPASICITSAGNVYTTEAGMSNYAWTVSAGGTKTSGGTSASNTVTVTWNTAGSQSVSVNYANATGCTAIAPVVYNVTVNPNNTITLTSGVGSNAQTKCINTAIFNITYLTTGATGATVTGLPAGVSGTWAANVVTISGTPTVSGTFNYTVTLSGGCSSVSATGSITVNPNNTITLTSGSGSNAQTNCVNTALSNITYSTTGATGVAVAGLPPGVTGTWTANVLTISGTPTVAGAFNYFVSLTGGCGTVTANGTITVNPLTIITSQPVAQTVCDGTSATFAVAAAGSGILTYQWQRSTDNGITWINMAGETNASVTVAASAAMNGNQVHCMVTADCGTVTSTSVLLSVHQLPTVNAGPDQSIGYGSAITLAGVTGGGAASALWSGGSGTFSNPAALNAVYTPGATDLAAGSVKLVLTTTNSSPCSEVYDEMTITFRYPLSGTVKYNNSAGTPLGGLTVNLLNSSSVVVASGTTTSTGAYTMNNYVSPGNYSITTDLGAKPVGGINSTDAGQVQYWFTHQFVPIQKVRFNAGDVTNDNYINMTDALNIQLYFVSSGAHTFTRDKWSYWSDGVMITSGDEDTTAIKTEIRVMQAAAPGTINILAQCTGDFNMSYIPASLKEASSILLIYSGIQQSGTNKEIELPVRMVDPVPLGAVSLVLEFPPELVMVKDVTMNTTHGNLNWAVNGNELRIGWNSEVPFIADADGDLVTLKLQTTAAFREGQSIRLALAPTALNELADADYHMIPDAILSVDVIENSPAIITPDPSGPELSFHNYPNPFADYTVFTYTLPAAGTVVLEIHDLLGRVVMDAVNEPQTTGYHRLQVDAITLPMGVYVATLKLMGGEGILSRTIKIVQTK